jgi:transposase
LNEGWPGVPGRRSALRIESFGSGARGSGRAAGLAKYGGPTWAHVTRWAGLILLVFLGKEGVAVLHVGLDLSRRRVDVCLISSEGELVEHFRAPADRDGLYGLTRRVAVYDEPVRGVVESMNGARFVHDELVRYGWEVLVADAQRVKGLAPLACKTDKVDARVLAELSFRDLVPAIWPPTPELRQERERSRWRLHLVKHRSILKNRVHASLIAFGHQVPMADLFGAGGRRLLAGLDFPEPWLGHVRASIELIDDLDRRIGEIERWLQRSGADHRYIPLLMTSRGSDGSPASRSPPRSATSAASPRRSS